MSKQGIKRGRPKNYPALVGLTDLDAPLYANFGSMKAASASLHLDISILKDAKDRGCPAFRDSGGVNREELLKWLKNNSQVSPPLPDKASPLDEDFEDNYEIADEAGGVGQTLQSLQAYERRLKKQLDYIERATNLHPAVKAERVDKAQKRWISVVGPLLKYDLSVSLAKRESGELIPLADAVKAVQALLAWHTVATSEALRNVIPNLEKKDKYQIAAILDPALRSSIYRNFKLGVKLGKIPDWMGKSATDFVRSEPPLGERSEPPLGERSELPLLMEKKTVSTNLDDY